MNRNMTGNVRRRLREINLFITYFESLKITKILVRSARSVNNDAKCTKQGNLQAQTAA
jgi:hypothetical protein